MPRTTKTVGKTTSAPSPFGDIEFWLDDLEMPLEHLAPKLAKPRGMKGWLAKLSGPQVRVIADIERLAPGQSVQKLRSDLGNRLAELVRYVPVMRFSARRLRATVQDVAVRELDDETLVRCGCDAAHLDIGAATCALWHQDREHLREIFHKEKLNRCGFAHMRLVTGGRSPQRPLQTILNSIDLPALLVSADEAIGDGRTSDLRHVTHHGDRSLLFIRRGAFHQRILRGTSIQHGYWPEWIILDFDSHARHVMIGSKTSEPSLIIAEHVASAYFGRDCTYNNEHHATYAAQLRHFLETLKDGRDPSLGLVRVIWNRSPLDGAAAMQLTHGDPASLRTSVQHLEQLTGEVFADPATVSGVDVLYRQKHVTITFEPSDVASGEFVVRYQNHRLTVVERADFEHHMRDHNAIQILSSEKRYHHRPRTRRATAA